MRGAGCAPTAPDWFERLTGFREDGYEATRRQLRVEGGELVSRVDGRRYAIGRLELPTLYELRLRARSGTALPGRPRHPRRRLAAAYEATLWAAVIQARRGAGYARADIETNAGAAGFSAGMAQTAVPRRHSGRPMQPPEQPKKPAFGGRFDGKQPIDRPSRWHAHCAEQRRQPPIRRPNGDTEAPRPSPAATTTTTY